MTESGPDGRTRSIAGDDSDVHRLLVEHTRELLCLLDVSGTLLFVSPSVFPLLGYAPADVMGRSPLDFVHPEDRDTVADALQSAAEGLEVPVLTCRFRGADGEHRWLEVQTRALRDENGAVTRLVTSSRDASNRIELLARVSTLRSVISSFDDLVFVFDPDGRFREYYQPNRRKRLHAPPEAFLGRHFSAVLPEQVAMPLGHALTRAKESGEPQEFDYDLVVGDEPRSYYAKITPLRGSAGTVGGFVGVVRDVTHRRSEELARVELLEARGKAERLDALAVLARGTAHEFNNILTAVQGNLALALDELPTDGPATAGIAAAIAAADRAAEVTRQLLTYTGASAARPLAGDLVELIEELEPGLRLLVPPGAQLEVRHEADEAPIEASPVLLASVVRHLTRNAIEALPEGHGLVTIRTFRREYGEEELARSRVQPLAVPGMFAGIEVRDDGEGIDADMLARIFDPFFSTRFLGRGLGLAEVSGIVRAHRGAILATSEPGAGSSFVVLIPNTMSRDESAT